MGHVPCLKLAAIAALVNHRSTRHLAYELVWIAVHVAIHLLCPHLFFWVLGIEALIAFVTWAIEVGRG